MMVSSVHKIIPAVDAGAVTFLRRLPGSSKSSIGAR
jgi:hypothetical protein